MAKFDLSISFPYFKIGEEITYTEVTKPTGIAYIILVLISKHPNKSEKIGNILTNFGIPKSLHYLFAETLNKLRMQRMILMHDSQYDFENLPLSKIHFSPEGKKMFERESISTGVNKVGKISIYYDIAHSNLMFNIDKDKEPRPLMDSFLMENFFDKFNSFIDTEAFFNLNKGKKWISYENGKISSELFIKKEEEILKIEELGSRENWLAKESYLIETTGDKCDFKFDDEVSQKFFNEFYTIDMINKSISFKNKFNFSSEFEDHLKMSTYTQRSIEKIILPNKLDDELKSKFKLCLTKGFYLPSSGNVVSSNGCFDNIDKNYQFMIVEKDNSIYAYVAGVFEFENENKGVLRLPLGLKIKSNIEELKDATKNYTYSLSEYSEENFKKLIEITNINGNVELAKEIILNYLSSDYLENINKLNLAKDLIFTNEKLVFFYKSVLKDNYVNLLGKLDSTNAESIIRGTKKVAKNIGLSTEENLDLIANNSSKVSDLKMYELLVSNGTKADLAATYFNPVPEFFEKLDSKESNLLDLLSVKNSIEKMNAMFNINEDLDRFDIYSNFDCKEFKNIFNNALNKFNKISFFKNNNNELIEKMNLSLENFRKINDDINMREQSSKNPKSIKKEIIEKDINLGNYTAAFANLAVKLEYVLTDKYGSTGEGLRDYINSSDIHDKKVIKALHEFRIARNNSLHIDKKADYSTDDLREWTNLIFELEDKYE